MVAPLSLDRAVSKRGSAWEHHKDGGAPIVHSRLCQRLTVSTRQVPESTMSLLDWAVSRCIHHCYAGWCQDVDICVHTGFRLHSCCATNLLCCRAAVFSMSNAQE